MSILSSASDRKERYLQIYEFLESFKGIWQTEVIHDDTRTFPAYPEHWVNSIEHFPDDILFILHQSETYQKQLPECLRSFFSSVCQLTMLPSFAENDVASPSSEAQRFFPPPAYQNLTPKKSHEIDRVFSYLLSEKHLPYDSSTIDFCGGAGYIARTLAYFCSSPSISVDYDKALQQRGQLKHQRYIPQNARKIDFIHLDLLSEYPSLHAHFPLRAPVIGLHTCAHLSDVQLALSVDLESAWTFNVGCCYFKTDKNAYTLSSFAREYPVPYTGFSLFLAARGQETSLEDFIFSQRVKRFRFLLHLFLEKEYGLGFHAVGSVPDSFYNNDFFSYAGSRLASLQSKNIINKLPSEKTLSAFLKDQAIQNIAHKMRMCNFLRSRFSRVLELAIALDRAIYLDENDFLVSIGEIFSMQVSPRNIAIFGTRQGIRNSN
jgi:hypothetical protein